MKSANPVYRVMPLGNQCGCCPHCNNYRSNTTSPLVCLACGSFLDETADSCPGCGRTFGYPGYVLQFRRGQLAGQRFRVPQGRYHVGRNILMQTNLYISQKQFEMINLLGQPIQICDCGAKNPTRINDLPVVTYQNININDEIRVGDSIACFINL